MSVISLGIFFTVFPGPAGRGRECGVPAARLALSFSRGGGARGALERGRRRTGAEPHAELPAAANEAAQASQGVCGASGCAAAAAAVQMALLLVPRLPHHRRLSEQREALQLAVAVKAISLASPFRPHCSVRRQQGALLASPSWARAGEAK